MKIFYGCWVETREKTKMILAVSQNERVAPRSHGPFRRVRCWLVAVFHNNVSAYCNWSGPRGNWTSRQWSTRGPDRTSCRKRTRTELTSLGSSVLSDQQAMVMTGKTSDQPFSVQFLLTLPETHRRTGFQSRKYSLCLSVLPVLPVCLSYLSYPNPNPVCPLRKTAALKFSLCFSSTHLDLPVWSTQAVWMCHLELWNMKWHF